MRAHGGNRLVLVALVFVAVAAAGCSGGSDAASTTPNTIEAGQANIQLPAGWKVVHGGVIRAPANSGGSADVAAAATGTTVPLAKQDPTTAFFTAIHTFQSCLSGLGVKFIGAPSAGNPNSPANNPAYIKSLTTCAAKSNIVQALKDEQTAQNNLTPKQIATENKVYLKWRTCMIGRGWGVPEPTPNAQGELFSFGASSSSTSNIKPPPGQSLLNSPDLQNCISKAEKEVPNSGSIG